MAIKHSTIKAALQKLFAIADWNADHTGTLDHGTELTNVTSDQHHAQSHNAVSHTDIASTGAQIDDAVSKKHSQNTDTALGAQSENLDMNTHKIVGVVDPVNNQEAATKKYVDDAVPGVGTEYWSVPGLAFLPRLGGDAVFRDETGGQLRQEESNKIRICPVNLPHGAVVTGAVVYGSATAEAETWTLIRVTLDTTTVATMATANIGTEDNSINNATIDNSTYAYFFHTSTLDAEDDLWGARITYTI